MLLALLFAPATALFDELAGGHRQLHAEQDPLPFALARDSSGKKFALLQLSTFGNVVAPKRSKHCSSRCLLPADLQCLVLNLCILQCSLWSG